MRIFGICLLKIVGPGPIQIADEIPVLNLYASAPHPVTLVQAHSPYGDMIVQYIVTTIIGEDHVVVKTPRSKLGCLPDCRWYQECS